MKQLRTSSCFFFLCASSFNSFNTRQTDLRYTTDNLHVPWKVTVLKGKQSSNPHFWETNSEFSGEYHPIAPQPEVICNIVFGSFRQVQLRNSVYFVKTTAVGVRCGWNHHQACNTTETSFTDVFEVIMPLSSISKWSIFHQARKSMKLLHPRNSTWTCSYEFPFHVGVIFRFQQFGGGNFDGQN